MRPVTVGHRGRSRPHADSSMKKEDRRLCRRSSWVRCASSLGGPSSKTVRADTQPGTSTSIRNCRLHPTRRCKVARLHKRCNGVAERSRLRRFPHWRRPARPGFAAGSVLSFGILSLGITFFLPFGSKDRYAAFRVASFFSPSLLLSQFYSPHLPHSHPLTPRPRCAVRRSRSRRRLRRSPRAALRPLLRPAPTLP